jgi:hypothetical protein
MTEIAIQTLPPGISRATLVQLISDQHNQEAHLQTVIHGFEARYDESLSALEARLARGEGQEHPDWEDSIEWRNAVESLRRARLMGRVLEWLLGSIEPSTAS